MTDLPKRRVRLSLDLQADSWQELQTAWSAIEFRLFAEQTEEAPVQVVSGGAGSGHVLSVTVNRDQTAAGYRRDLDAYVAQLSKEQEQKQEVPK